MLDSVVEFITEAASSTAFIFCFCNLIIVIILVDLKPSLSFDQESETLTGTVTQGASSKCIIVNKTISTQQGGEVLSHAIIEEVAEGKIGAEEGNNNGDGCCNDEEEEEEELGKDDDELRRRVEEFIEKVNKGWKAEYISTSS